jgi:L-ornithine N5-oxygenase
VVVGAGQSAAEIFNNVQTLYPNARTWLVVRSEFLKPSDDSPFVNSIFNPAFVDRLYVRSPAYRQYLAADARATNYGVVRLELIEHLYEKMYHQRRELGADETKWPHRIMGGRKVVGVQEVGDKLLLTVRQAAASDGEAEAINEVHTVQEEVLDVDLIISATGYRRSAHVDMLRDVWPLLPVKTEEPLDEGNNLGEVRGRWEVQTSMKGGAGLSRLFEVARDYRLCVQQGSVAKGSGIWLQGCCEGTHGVSRFQSFIIQ